jgi:hypothetical protein
MENPNKGDETATGAEDHSRTIGWISEKTVTENDSQQGQNFASKKIKCARSSIKNILTGGY